MPTLTARPLLILLYLISKYGDICERPPTQNDAWRIIAQIADEDGEIFGDYLPREDEPRTRGAHPKFVAHVQDLLHTGLVTLQNGRLEPTDVGRQQIPVSQSDSILPLIERYIKAAC